MDVHTFCPFWVHPTGLAWAKELFSVWCDSKRPWVGFHGVGKVEGLAGLLAGVINAALAVGMGLRSCRRADCLLQIILVLGTAAREVKVRITFALLKISVVLEPRLAARNRITLSLILNAFADSGRCLLGVVIVFVIVAFFGGWHCGCHFFVGFLFTKVSVCRVLFSAFAKGVSHHERGGDKAKHFVAKVDAKQTAKSF